MNTADLCPEGLRRYKWFTRWDNHYSQFKTLAYRYEKQQAWQRWQRHAKKCEQCGGQR